MGLILPDTARFNLYTCMQLLYGYDVLYTPYRKILIVTLSGPYIFTVDQSYLIHHGLEDRTSGHCYIDPVYMHNYCCMAIAFVAHVAKHVAVHLVRSIHFHYRPKLANKPWAWYFICMYHCCIAIGFVAHHVS